MKVKENGNIHCRLVRWVVRNVITLALRKVIKNNYSFSSTTILLPQIYPKEIIRYEYEESCTKMFTLNLHTIIKTTLKLSMCIRKFMNFKFKTEFECHSPKSSHPLPLSLKHVKYHVWNELPVQVRCTILDAWGWCTGTTQRDGMGREEGGGFRMGNTCIPVVDSFWYLAKLIQLCKV